MEWNVVRDKCIPSQTFRTTVHRDGGETAIGA
jgi:hypothetical protein